MKILVLDNTRDPEYFGSSNISSWLMRMAPAGTEVHVRRPPHDDLPNEFDSFDGVVISGSATSCLTTEEKWIRPYVALVGKLIEKKVPLFGICYGHQTIARYLFEKAGVEPKLRKSLTPECGWQEIQVLETGTILEGLPEKFYTYQSHYEEVAEVPPGAVNLGMSPRCAIQGFYLPGKSVFAVQFHPETGIEQVERTLQIKIKRGEPRDWILNAGRGNQLYNDQVGKVIFGNFVRIAGEYFSQRKS